MIHKLDEIFVMKAASALSGKVTDQLFAQTVITACEANAGFTRGRRRRDADGLRRTAEETDSTACTACPRQEAGSTASTDCVAN